MSLTSPIKIYIPGVGSIECNDLYLKDEVDRCFKELKSEIERLEILCANYRHDCDNLAISNEQAKRAARTLLKKMNHNKYKRCLAMADKCVDLCHKAKDLYRWAEDENLEHHYNHKIEFFARWHNRWLKLAEKYKEGNV